MHQGNIRIGISGWRYAPWRGVFYPPDLPQRRELEYASGLRESPFLNVMEKHVDPQSAASIRERWPVSLREAFLATLAHIDSDPIEALVKVYAEPARHPHHFALAEVLSEYELLFQSWRFAHLKLVERTIGNRITGTAGSAGHGYLARTLQYRFFPELLHGTFLGRAGGFNNATFTAFARYGGADTNAASFDTSDRTEAVVGLNYRPIQTFVVKTEWQRLGETATGKVENFLWSSVAVGF